MTLAAARRRLDAELVRRGLASSRTEAQEAIRAGLVTVDGAPAAKPAHQVLGAQALVVAGPPRDYVSRGGHKLAHALDVFAVDPAGRSCLDAGVSTGGFTDCLLQRGAAEVLAYDVGYGQVHETIRTDPRVTVSERTNVRTLTPEAIPGAAPTLLVADLSFISLTTVLPALRAVGAPNAEAVLLVKPQFEADRADVGKGGVVRDPGAWRRSLHRVTAAAAALGWRLAGATASPLLGPSGNVEFLVHLVPDDHAAVGPDHDAPDRLVESAVQEGARRRDTSVPGGQRSADGDAVAAATPPARQHGEHAG